MALPQRSLRTLHLFAGAGGGILADLLLRHTPICAVEINPYCRNVLLQRQRDGCLPRFPIWDDVRTFDGKPWAGAVDVVAGGFPCQDISAAGKGAGLTGARSGLWSEFARIICEVLPAYVFVENSPMLTLRGLDRVLGELAALGYDARWGVLGADDIGAPHRRERIWIVGTHPPTFPGNSPPSNANGLRSHRAQMHDGDEGREVQSRDEQIGLSSPLCEVMANSSGEREYKQTAQEIPFTNRRDSREESSCGSWWHTEPDVDRVADGIPFGVDRLTAIGNAQVCGVAKLAWKILS